MVGAFYIPAFLSALSQHAVTIMLPLYALQFDDGPALAALMLGARGAGVMLSDLPAGMLVTRFGDMWIMCVGLGMMVVVTAAAAFCDSPLGFVAGGAGIGRRYRAVDHGATGLRDRQGCESSSAGASLR